MVKLAAVSCPSDARNKQANLDKMIEWAYKGKEQGVDIMVFPEDHLTGLGTHFMNEFFPPDKLYTIEIAELVPEGPSTQKMIEVAKDCNMYIAWGMAERDPNRYDALYNCCVLVGPEGFVGKYRKVHLPLCERLMVLPGFDYPVFDTKFGKVGLMTCYDKMYPEVAKSLALQGADIILCSTGWPNLTQSLDDPDHIAYMTISPARALENMIVWVEATTCNGAGSDPIFEGHSMILGPNPGQIFAQIGFEEGMAVAEVDVEKEIVNARVVSMGGSDINRDRVPSTYWRLTEFNEYQPFSAGLKNHNED